VAVTRLSGGNTPADGADPRTFPAIWNATADDLEAFEYSRLVSVKHVVKTGTETFTSVTQGDLRDITGLEITHTLASSSNKVILTGYATMSEESGTNRVGLVFADGATSILIADTAASRFMTMVGSGQQAAATTNMLIPHATVVYSPGDTSAHTYKMRIQNLRPFTQSIFVNRDAADTTSSVRGTCSFVLYEVVA
jgi:hypothetical protein